MNDIISKVGLTSCKDTWVGGCVFRSLSSGQLRRLSIAQQLIRHFLLFIPSPSLILATTLYNFTPSIKKFTEIVFSFFWEFETLPTQSDPLPLGLFSTASVFGQAIHKIFEEIQLGRRKENKKSRQSFRWFLCKLNHRPPPPPPPEVPWSFPDIEDHFW